MSARRIGFATVIGPMYLEMRGDILSRVGWRGAEERAGPPRDRPRSGIEQSIVDRIQQHLTGDLHDFRDIQLDRGQVSPFSWRVLEALREVPAGRVTTYGALAALAGRPGAARAVGAVMARNPWPIVVPCHRVVGARGRLGGYSGRGGAVAKVEILLREGLSPAKIYLGARSFLARADGRLRPLCRQAPRAVTTPAAPIDPFHDLATIVVMQQLSSAAGRTLVQRLVGRLGGAVPMRPDDILRLGAAGLRSCGLSRSKGQTLLALAGMVRGGELDLRDLERRPDQQVRRTLTSIRGIGPWTADLFLLFHLGRPDVVPAGDLGLRRAVQVLYGLAEFPRPAALHELSERWRPYRSIASRLLWWSLSGEPAWTPRDLL